MILAMEITGAGVRGETRHGRYPIDIGYGAAACGISSFRGAVLLVARVYSSGLESDIAFYF